MNYSDFVFDEDEDLDEILKQIEAGDDDDEEDRNYEAKLSPKKFKRCRIITPNITAILDRAKVSDRMSARVLCHPN